MKNIIFIIGILSTSLLYCQSEKSEIIKFKVMFDNKEPMKTANIIVKNSNPATGTTTNLNGYAELNIKNKNQTIAISIIGPSLSFKLINHVDSVFINLKKRKIIFFNKGRRVKKVKPLTFAL